ncbi:hypothetical protein ACFXG4_48630 [Nocardia sp. NPDC059246]|uniref:hypothetical protein n=1 Tax=unclassified Nocardia TaxID=2637762 RepID=UPI0036A824EA
MRSDLAGPGAAEQEETVRRLARDVGLSLAQVSTLPDDRDLPRLHASLEQAGVTTVVVPDRQTLGSDWLAVIGLDVDVLIADPLGLRPRRSSSAGRIRWSER